MMPVYPPPDYTCQCECPQGRCESKGAPLRGIGMAFVLLAVLYGAMALVCALAQ